MSAVLMLCGLQEPQPGRRGSQHRLCVPRPQPPVQQLQCWNAHHYCSPGRHPGAFPARQAQHRPGAVSALRIDSSPLPTSRPQESGVSYSERLANHISCFARRYTRAPWGSWAGAARPVACRALLGQD